MTTTVDLFTVLGLHCAEATKKHKPFAAIIEVQLALIHRQTKLAAAAGSDADPDQNTQIARRLIQTATIPLQQCNP